MKIAFINQPFNRLVPPEPTGSIPIWIYHVARYLARSNSVIIYGRGGRLRRKAQLHNGVHYKHIPVGPDHLLIRLLKRCAVFRNVQRPLFSSSLYHLGYILQVAIDVRALQCDIVHLVNFSQFVPILRAFNPKVKIVVHMQCEWLTQLDQARIDRRLRKTDLVIGCSHYITEKVRQRFPQFASRCHTIYNGVDTDTFTEESPDAKAGIDNVKRVLFVGRVSPEKGVHVLIEAFKRVVERYPRARLEIAGGMGRLPREYFLDLTDNDKVLALTPFYKESSRSSYFFHLQEQVRSWGLTRQVGFLDDIPNTQLIDYYRNADVFVFPSVWEEPFGIPPIEAMAVGVPVVGTRSGGMAETVEEGKTGLLVEPGNADALAEAMLRLLENEDLRIFMGKAARERAMRLFAWERIVEPLECLYNDLCGRNE